MSKMLKIAASMLFLCSTAVPPQGDLYAEGRPRNPTQRRTLQQQQTGRARLPRPQSNAMRVRKISPEMMQVLKNWEKASGKVKKLRCKHHRQVYNKVYHVEKISRGEVFYEGPDKGRIDIAAVDIKNRESVRLNPRTKKPYKLQSDQPESWRCDGKHIWQISHADKTAEGFKLPPDASGTHIMDGPLPFLFGMPAELAKERYDLEFAPDKPADRPENEIWLNIKPRWPRDAANWSRAKVVLDQKNYLPLFVQMFDPNGTLETVYSFFNFKINGIAILPARWTKDPYAPPRGGYKVTLTPVKVPMPSVIGLSAKEAKKVIEKSGLKVAKWIRGTPASNKNLTYVVFEQKPTAKTVLKEGDSVILTVYDEFGMIPRRAAKPRNGKKNELIAK